MLSGDFGTFPVADLLQWFDHSRKAGVVEVERPLRPSFWIQVRDRQLVAASQPLDVAKDLQALIPWVQVGDNTALWKETCRDRLLDLFFEKEGGRFVFAQDLEGFDDGVPLEIGVAEVLFEGLRRLDEWPLIDRAFPSEDATLSLLSESTEEGAIKRAIVEAARSGRSIAEVRLSLGLSRPALLYRLEPLCTAGLIRVVDEHRPSPVAAILRQTKILLKERQLDEAVYVLERLGAAYLPEPAVLELWREVEREQLAALYEEMSPLAVPKLTATKPKRPLSPIEQEVASHINGRFDVASLTLASSRRELDTLRSLRRLVRLGVVEFA